MKNKAKLINGILIAGFILITIFCIVILFNEKKLLFYCREDGVVEWAQAFCLLLSFIFFIIRFFQNKNEKGVFSWLILAFALLCLFGFLEEISYGQRLFSIKSPYYFERHNAHREINIHNLMVFDSVTEAGIVGVYLVWCIILPAILFFKKEWKKFLVNKCLYTPPAFSSLFCIAGLAIELYARYRYQAYWANSNEVLELFLCYSILCSSLDPEV